MSRIIYHISPSVHIGHIIPNERYNVSQVRQIAHAHHYTEISLNERSRVISFREDRVRINVYYTTGTVGTCVNHPTKGKTQLFRRNVTLPELKQLFQNPRSHTGKGYYRKHAGQKWKSSASGTLISDAARRWEYVAGMAGLLSGESNTTAGTNLQTLMDEISKSSKDDGVMDVELKDHVNSRFVVAFKMESDYAEKLRCTSYDVTQYVRLLDLLGSLPRLLRIEICHWLVGMLEPDHVLIQDNITSSGLFPADENVRLAHLDYSKSFYTNRQYQYLNATYGVIMA